MVRQRHPLEGPHPVPVRFFLWTIRKQDQITRCLTMNMWSAVSAVLAIALVGLITLEMALKIIFVGGLAAVSLIWILIERRKSWLLGISDPRLKAEAHRAMIDYLRKKLCSGDQCRNQPNDKSARPVA